MIYMLIPSPKSAMAIISLLTACAYLCCHKVDTHCWNDNNRLPEKEVSAFKDLYFGFYCFNKGGIGRTKRG